MYLSLHPYFLCSSLLFVFPFTCARTSDLAQEFAQGLNPVVLLHFHIFLYALRSLTLSHFLGNCRCLHLCCSVHFTTRERDLSFPTSPLQTPSVTLLPVLNHDNLLLISCTAGYVLSPQPLSFHTTKLLFSLIRYLLYVSRTRH